MSSPEHEPGASPPPAGRPPKTTFNRIYQLLYWLFVVGLLGSIAFSVTWHVLFRPLNPDEVSTAPLDPASCRSELSAHYQALNHSAQQILFGQRTVPADVEQRWVQFLETWRPQFAHTKSRCPFKELPELHHIAADIERMQVAWSTALRALTEIGARPLKRLPQKLNLP